MIKNTALQTMRYMYIYKFVRICFDCFACHSFFFFLFALRCEHSSLPYHVPVFDRYFDFIDHRNGALCNFDDVQADLITAQECTCASRCDRSLIKLPKWGKLLINIHAERFNYYSLLRACQYSESVLDASSIEVDVVDRIPPVLSDTPLSLSAVK